jgi:hypothetical protein
LVIYAVAAGDKTVSVGEERVLYGTGVRRNIMEYFMGVDAVGTDGDGVGV